MTKLSQNFGFVRHRQTSRLSLRFLHATLGAGVGWNPVEFEGLGMEFKNRARRFEEQIEAVLKVRPAVFSFIFGMLPADQMAEVKRLGIVTISTATSGASIVQSA